MDVATSPGTAVTASTCEDRRRQLLDAADRVIRRDGPSASMDVIAAEAGISKPILYRHFGDKGELFRLLAAWTGLSLLETGAGDAVRE